jgi:hypothetical protein
MSVAARFAWVAPILAAVSVRRLPHTAMRPVRAAEHARNTPIPVDISWSDS